ncbi:MAG: transposase [Sandaracinaceae bacterium]|nr:transposase [Sandaracinaceae bacterium]
MAHEHGSVARREAGLSVGEIARAHGERVRAEHALSPEQHKVLRAIERCRTAALGGHLHACPACGFQQPRHDSHRVGVSNARLIRYDGETVTFATKDGKTCTQNAVDFLARLLRRTLPRGFHKIRHAGLVSTNHVRVLTLARAQAALAGASTSARGVELDARQSPRTWVELMLALHGRDPLRCPHCDTPLLVLPLPTSMPKRVEGIDSS